MVNNVVLVGRLTRDPELRRTSTGLSVASFSIAVDDSRRNSNGEKTTIFMPVSVWGKTADTVVKFVKKGHLVGVLGRLIQRKYTRKNDGAEITSTEVSAYQIEFMEPKGNAQNSDEEDIAQYTPQELMAKELESLNVPDADLPF